MDDQFTIKHLKAQELTDMYLTFLDAFSDYPISFRLTKEQFVRKFVQKLNIDFQLSSGAYDYSGAMMAFIFTSINHYRGEKTAYNGGTGVRPRSRGHGLTRDMYSYLVPLFKKANVTQCILEVLTENHKAIKVYEQIGFEKTQLFKCFKLESQVLKSTVDLKLDLEIFNVNHPDFDTYKKFNTYVPSFLDSSKLLLHNLANETIVEARHNGKCVAFAIFQSSIGRISQIGVNAETRNMGIGSALIKYIFDTSAQKALTILNVSENAVETLGFLTRCGFENQIDQYEMRLVLSKA